VKTLLVWRKDSPQANIAALADVLRPPVKRAPRAARRATT
jgi:hypothetical protein